MENQTIQSKLLDFVLLERDELSESNIRRMFELMEQSYDYVNYETFLHDLGNKNYVGLLFDNFRTIQGFTTFGINPKGTGRAGYSIIFSGDTVISPLHWGTQEMMRGWATSVGKIMSTDTTKTWYWFLLSKGHRTYMYLPLFFHEYYPSLYQPENPLLKSIIDETASKLYGQYYRPDETVIVFKDKMGELKPSLAQSTFEKQNKPHVRFFLHKNPGFYKGDELVCLADLRPDNIRGYGKKYILEGMEQTFNVDESK
ncbi:hypothetical protein [Segetibacter aerophilus]|uniref:N-acetyltransferase domain-containing protein n=1 Tax=Segetibacter aerophilus TaxID=670293 RepID=A0A512BJB8_9BACT|nr:hypothetical protein [Segetibacter aerophilus]GEO12056.1 hypothetical protein SAE01_45520 [Segetibacter aerophilus]